MTSTLPATASLFLWPGQALYIGIGQDSTVHHHYALQVGLSVDQPLHIRATPQDSFTAVAGCIVAPNASHQILSAQSQSLFVWSEIKHRLPPRLDSSATSGITLLTQAELQSVMPLIERAFAQSLTCTTAMVLMTNLLQTLGLADPVRSPIDLRIAASMQHIRQADEALLARPVQSLAHQVHMSASRFRHLFKQHVGISVQRYVLWQRILSALRLSTLEPSLTGAAHAAGFADSAHFARVFRATFGLTPSAVLKDSQSVQVIPCLPD